MLRTIILTLFFLLSLGQQEFFYNQKLNHFGNLNTTFAQRYFVDQRHWRGAAKRAPILALFGGENSIMKSINNIGILTASAPRFGALVVYLEHRFYGKSVPLGSIDKAMADPSVRACLSIEQAMQDFYELLLVIKSSFSATNSPVIVMGGSYPGMLAAYFRLKYPSQSVGALASSAPIFYFSKIMHNQDAACSIVDKDFKEINRPCYERIKQSWNKIDEIGLSTGGLFRLSQIFKLCFPLTSVDVLKENIVQFYSTIAQYNGRYNYYIDNVCDAISSSSDKDILEVISAKMIELSGNGELCTTVNNNNQLQGLELDLDSQRAWKYLVHWAMGLMGLLHCILLSSIYL